MSSFRIAVLQTDTQDDKAANLKMIAEMIDEAAEGGAKFLAMPEMVNYIGTRSGFLENAEIIPDGVTSRLFSEKAKHLGIWIHGGSICEISDDNSRVCNTSIVFNPSGELAAKYRKIHLYDVEAFRESDSIKAGNEIVTFNTEFGVMGLSICYDLRFPEIYSIMANKGAKLIFVPAQFNIKTGPDHWEVLLRARAIENTCYIIAPDQIGKKRNFPAYGRSMIIDSWGNVIAKASDKPGIIFADIDINNVDSVREKMPSLRHRRPEIYGG